MPNVRLVIEYDGSHFHGWQMQPGVRTIEGEIERVLEMVLREKIHPVYASGRTDAGVHARGQVINFFTSQEQPDVLRVAHSLSNILRGQLSVLQADIVPDDFNSRYSSVSKQYTYSILNRLGPAVLDYGKVWYIGSKLDPQRMNEEAKAVIGEHDFTSFRGTGCNAKTPVKTILESEVLVDGPFIRYRVVGTGFLKHMVRNLAGTLVDLSRDFLSLKSMGAILAARDRKQAGVTAPAHGLCLDWVRYKDESAAGAAR
ncbi:MAG: tRNA pseudouridine(38-40) synthase TruA [Deltaproteobacteria bacterium]|nr:tRNA pseudouridine(38-40) synthase TruA [Deltaproteobacteria bacterium]